jgi:RNA polymerase sigma-70 factor (ECF subfamily)
MGERHPATTPSFSTPVLFSSLVDQHQHALSTFLHGLVGDVEQARDLTQDTFHDAWRAAREGAAPFAVGCTEDEQRRWLFHVAYHKGISALRRRRLIRWESLDLLRPLMAWRGTEASFEDQVVEGEALRAALARLSPQDSACLLLRVVQGLSAAEVGQIVGASPETVTKRLSRAKQRLRAIYLAHNAPSEGHQP